MNRGLKRKRAGVGMDAALMAIVMCLLAGPAAYGQASAETSADEGAETVEQASEAERHYRRGIDLYEQGVYRESLNEFSRALALDPSMEKARDMIKKAEGRIALSTIGEEADTSPTEFEIIDSQTLPSPAEGGTPQLSAQELKYTKVKELMEQGQFYLEHNQYDRALELFEEILIIDPANKTATRLLAEATLGAYDEDISDMSRDLSLQNQFIRRGIERDKLLPEGADEKGILPARPTIPVEEESIFGDVELSEIEKALDAPVSIEFDDEYVGTILEFIADYVGINIVLDTRAVLPEDTGTGAQQTPAAGGRGAAFQGRGGARGGARGGGGGGGGGLGAGLTLGPGFAAQAGAGRGGTPAQQFDVSSGVVPFIKLDDVPLRQALQALLRPLNLDFSIQPEFLWVSSFERIRTESFERLETKIYDLKHAGSETLFKIVVQNPGGFGGNQGGRGGGGGGGFGGGGGGGGFGGGGGGFGGGGGGAGGFGGGGGGFGGGGGGIGGGGGGRQGNIQIANISQLFSSINDLQVGEPPAQITLGISEGSTGVGDQQGGAAAGGGGLQGGFGGGGLGGGGTTGQDGEFGAGQTELLQILERFVPEVIDPSTGEVLSTIIFNPSTNQLMVQNTPSNLKTVEELLYELDRTPKQVSIESKFLTIRVTDLDQIGFSWDIGLSDLNSRPRQILGPDGEFDIDNGLTTPSGAPGYQFDINGDGVLETIPFYTRPDGTSVITNSITQGIVSAITNPGGTITDAGLSLSGILTDNGDGDRVSVTLDYLNSLEETELLSAPRITTMNRKPAVIADILTRSFVTFAFQDVQAVSGGLGGGAAAVGSTAVFPQQFIFGITFSVTPQISGDNQVRLWLNPQVTTLAGQDNFVQTAIVDGQELTQTLTVPRTLTQAVWTNVIVNDGDTLVLGGTITDDTTKAREKLPYLADIPVIGYFFRGKSTEVRQQSLLIFVTVDIIDPSGARFFESDV